MFGGRKYFFQKNFIDNKTKKLNIIQKYLESVFEIDANTSATILITLSIFIIGISIQQLLLLFSKFIERRKTRKIFKISLTGFIKQVKKQSEGYNETAKSFTFDEQTNFEFTRATIYTLSSLNSIGYQKTYEAFFTGFENIWKCNLNLKLKAFNKVWDSIKSVEFWHQKSFEDLSDFIDKYNDLNEKRNIAIENHRRFFESIITEINNKSVPAKVGLYIQDVDRIHVDWQKLKNRTRPNIIHRYLIIKLRIINRKNSNIKIVNRMNENLLDATKEYQNQRNLLKTQKDQFENYSMNFKLFYRLSSKAKNVL